MVERDRVLMSCKLVWDSLDEYGPILESHAIDIDAPRFEGQQLDEKDLLPVIDGYAGILAGDDILNRRVIEAASRLRVISKWGIGVDAIDLDAAKEAGIKVFNTPGVFGDELGDYALGYLLMLARRQHEVDRRVRLGQWYKVRGTSLAGKTIGIIGLGSSGSALARRTAAMGMRVLGFDIQPPTGDAETTFELVDLATLLSESDMVSLHLPATESTRGLVDSDFLKSMKPGAWLINISRGSLVDEAALEEALISGQIAAAALDVFQFEPVRPNHPLLRFDNVVVGSHNGSNTHEAVKKTTERAMHNLLVGLGKVK